MTEIINRRANVPHKKSHSKGYAVKHHAPLLFKTNLVLMTITVQLLHTQFSEGLQASQANLLMSLKLA